MKKSNWHGGKGSTPRTNTNSKQYQDNWEAIFGKARPNISTRSTPNTTMETSKALAEQYVIEWEKLSDVEKATEKISNGNKYKQYCIAQKYGKDI
jgi:hypothetical protein